MKKLFGKVKSLVSRSAKATTVVCTALVVGGMSLAGKVQATDLGDAAAVIITDATTDVIAISALVLAIVGIMITLGYIIMGMKKK